MSDKLPQPTATLSKRLRRAAHGANARLIAAAPELLAACSALVDASDQARSSMASGLRREIEQVRAAMTKAEGR